MEKKIDLSILWWFELKFLSSDTTDRKTAATIQISVKNTSI